MFQTLTGWGDGPLLNLHVKDINGCESLCGSGLRYLASDFYWTWFFQRRRKKSARLSAELMCVYWEGGSVWGAGCVSSKLARTIVFMCQSIWQGLQTEGRWWRAGGSGELVKGNPREEIMEQYRPSALFCCRLWQSAPQRSAACQNPQAEVRIQQYRLKGAFASLNKQLNSQCDAALQPQSPHKDRMSSATYSCIQYYRSNV